MGVGVGGVWVEKWGSRGRVGMVFVWVGWWVVGGVGGVWGVGCGWVGVRSEKRW